MNNKQLRLEVMEALRINPLMVLATTDENGQPQCNTLVYTIDDDLNFYFITRSNTKKSKNIEANPNVSLSACFRPPYNIEAIGKAEPVTDEETKLMIMDAFAQHVINLENIWPPIFRYSQDEYVFYKIVPTSLRALEMKKQHITEDEPPFYQLI
jgi:nitroimidazol reductase NimA-like FMN-containing flavoprotein (pyridoxamine 5'-phosphate oxidase superfamily)